MLCYSDGRNSVRHTCRRRNIAYLLMISKKKKKINRTALFIVAQNILILGLTLVYFQILSRP